MKISKDTVSNSKDKKIITKKTLDDISEEVRLKELQKEADILNKIPEYRAVRLYAKKYR